MRYPASEQSRPRTQGRAGLAEFQHPRILVNEITGLDGVMDAVVLTDQHASRLPEPQLGVAWILALSRSKLPSVGGSIDAGH
jgi:hypothetical protein